MGKDGKDSERVTTTLSRSRKRQLDELAGHEGVSAAWVIRRAVERYLDSLGGSPVISRESDNA